MPSAFRGARPSHPRRACGRRAPLVLGGWMHGSPAPCPGGHPRIRRPPLRRAATFSLRNGTKRQFGTVRRGLPGSLGRSWPRRRPKTPGRGRPPFPRGRGHRTKPPFCATSGRKGGGATPGTRSRRVRRPSPPGGGPCRLRGDFARLRAHAGSRARPCDPACTAKQGAPAYAGAPCSCDRLSCVTPRTPCPGRDGAATGRRPKAGACTRPSGCRRSARRCPPPRPGRRS